MRAVALALVAGLCPMDARGADLMPAQPPNPWDMGFGAAVMSDFNIRGITQSAHKPAFNAYVEPRYAIGSDSQLYGGLSGTSIDFPNGAAAQIVLYGGIRPTIGKLIVDLGAWYLYYPGGTQFDGLFGATSCTNRVAAHCNTIKADLGFWEAYARPTYAITDAWSVGGNFYYSPSVLNSGAYGSYVSVMPKATLPSSFLPPGFGASISAELGRYRFGTTDTFYGVPAFPSGIKLPDYTTWNIGLSLTYRIFTLDLRYYDTDLSKANCNVQTGDHTAAFGGGSAVTPINPSGLVSNWCGAAFIAKLSVDTALAGIE